MIRILFVDDEKNILDGLRRAMHCMRSEWDMSFAASGAGALESLSRAPADVIVTDMRMPGMNGRDLLFEVKRLYPEAVRFILSGYANKTSIMEVVGSAHQYLSKPCEAITLKAAITRSFALRGLLQDERLMQKIGRIDTLPTLPGTYQRIVACLRGPDPELAEIAGIISSDVVMTAMILKLANSAFFGAGKTFKSADRAVAFLGLDTIGGLVLGHCIFNERATAGLSGFNMGALWKHSLATAAGARALALHEKWDTARVEEAFLAGVLHDLGKLILAMRAEPVLDDADQAADDDHAAVGAYLLGLWGFSDTMIEAIAYHHTPSKVSTQEFGLAGLLHVVDRLAHSIKSGSVPQFEPGYLEALGATPRIADWQAVMSKAADEATS